ncbi:MAG: class I SAM-dependent methyltransferase [Rhabdochlamydiaceae bacterium]|nr:class I SAM-dependent methyltransferase [Rhabdochlamydiaceae bacterium]
MLDEVVLREKQKYEKIWKKGLYRITSPGNLLVPAFLSQIRGKLEASDSLIDFGCGTARAAIPFLDKGLKVTLVDIAENCLDEKIEIFSHLCPERLSFVQAPIWDLPPQVPVSDWIYCIDVLEHLPVERVIPSLKAMAEKTRKGGALQVFLSDEEMGEVIGETLHLTIRPLDWWLKQISLFWDVERVEEMIPQIRYCIYVGLPKQTKAPE